MDGRADTGVGGIEKRRRRHLRLATLVDDLSPPVEAIYDVVGCVSNVTLNGPIGKNACTI